MSDQLQRWEATMRKNMASAERDYRTQEDHRRGFAIGAVSKLWETYQARQMNEPQFDHLTKVLECFDGGAYRELIQKMVSDYKHGNPPIIVGY